MELLHKNCYLMWKLLLKENIKKYKKWKIYMYCLLPLILSLLRIEPPAREHSPPSLICALAWTPVSTHLPAWSAPWPGPMWTLTYQPDLRPGLDPREYSPPSLICALAWTPVNTHLPPDLRPGLDPPWALTSQPDLRPGLDLPVGPAHKALVHPVVIPLNAEDLDGEE